MTELFDWLEAGKYAIIVIATVLIVGWFDRIRIASNYARNANRMVTPWPLSIFMVVFFLMMAGVDIGLIFFEDEPGTPILIILFVVLNVLAVYALCESLLTTITIKPAGFEYRLPEKRGEISWRDIESVKFGAIGRYFRIRTSDGRKVRVSVALTNLPEFAKQLLGHASTSRIDKKTLELLDQTAQGNPPSISW